MLKSLKLRCQSSLEIEILLMIFRITFLQKVGEKGNEHLHNATEIQSKTVDLKSLRIHKIVTQFLRHGNILSLDTV